jgi:predicted MFS family arabinose efflux permease
MLKTWLPALAGMCCLGLGPGMMAIYGFFIAPLSKEFGVGAALLNVGPVALLLVPAFLGAVVGKLADRVPVRKLLLIGATVGMLSLMAVGAAPTLLLAALGFLSFSVGLMFYGPVVVNGMLVKLFPGREARALSVAAIGISIAAAALPPLMGTLLEYLDWRSALQSLAAGLLVLLWLVIIAGVPRSSTAEIISPPAPASGALYHNAAFWLIGLSVALALNVMIVLAVCFPPLFTGRGYSVAEAGWLVSLGGIAGLVGKSCLAWVGDRARHFVKWLAAGALLLQATGFSLLYLASDTWMVVVALSLLGIGNGAFIPMHPYLNSRYFDAAINSEVTGAQMPLFLPFGLIGAPLAGYVYDQTGSYEPVLLALVAILAVAVLLVSRLPAPAK